MTCELDVTTEMLGSRVGVRSKVGRERTMLRLVSIGKYNGMKSTVLATSLAAVLLAAVPVAGAYESVDLGAMQDRARGGDAAAMLALGKRYLATNDVTSGLLYLDAATTATGTPQAAYAHTALGEHYAKSKAPGAHDRAKAHLQEAAILGDVAAQVGLGRLLITMIESGSAGAQRQDYEGQAIAVLDHAASAGESSEAAFLLGKALLEGTSLPRDVAAAGRWLELAARAKVPGSLRLAGQAAKQRGDSQQAASFFERGALAGDGESMLAYASGMFDGSFGKKDLRKAQQWADRAADSRVPGATELRAAVASAVSTERAPAQLAPPAPAIPAWASRAPSAAAIPVPEYRSDDSELERLRKQTEYLTQQLAMLQGRVAPAAATERYAAPAPATAVTDAYRAESMRSTIEFDAPVALAPPVADENQLGMVAHAQGDFDRAFKLFSRAARSGSADAMNNLGMMNLKGQGVRADINRALSYFTQAATLGHIQASKNMGYIYANGIGVHADQGRSVAWYQFASKLQQKSANTGYAGI